MSLLFGQPNLFGLVRLYDSLYLPTVVLSFVPHDIFFAALIRCTAVRLYVLGGSKKDGKTGRHKMEIGMSFLGKFVSVPATLMLPSL